MSVLFAYEVTAIHDLLSKRPEYKAGFSRALKIQNLDLIKEMSVIDAKAKTVLELSSGYNFTAMILGVPIGNTNDELAFSWDPDLSRTNMNLLALFRHFLAHRTDKTEAWQKAQNLVISRALSSGEILEFAKLSRLKTWNDLQNLIEQLSPRLILKIRASIMTFVRADNINDLLALSEMREMMLGKASHIFASFGLWKRSIVTEEINSCRRKKALLGWLEDLNVPLPQAGRDSIVPFRPEAKKLSICDSVEMDYTREKVMLDKTIEEKEQNHQIGL